MALALLLQRGIDALGTEHRAGLVRVVRDGQQVDAVLAALGYLPATLTSLAEVAWREDASTLTRSVLPVVLSYGFKKGNLIPAEEGQPLLGIVDDAYLALYAATRIVDLLPGLSSDALLAHTTALKDALPDGVADELEAMIDGTMAAIADAGVR